MNKTVHIIDYIKGKVRTHSQIEQEFKKYNREIKQMYNNDVNTYICNMCNQNKMLIVENNGYLVSDRIFSPSSYAKLINIRDIKNNNITLEEFDKIVADKYDLWNYPLTEYLHIVENRYRVVLVKFSNGEFRFVEV